VPSIHHRWAPLEDHLPSELQSPAEALDPDRRWQVQRERLAELDHFRDYEEKLRREWAIETGLIERPYTLDRRTTQLLAERGIHSTFIPGGVANPAVVVTMIADHKAVIDELFEFAASGRRLSVSYVKELHALATRNQEFADAVDALGRMVSAPLTRGAFKRLPNNPMRSDGKIHEYCPPEQVDSEMDRLIALHHQHTGVAPEIEAAWLHHRFSQIHPFQDGNGRIARALSTLVFLKAGWWPLLVRGCDRSHYFDLLEMADRGDLKPLAEYFARLQREEIERAIGLLQPPKPRIDRRSTN
jgi:Fic family protein